MVRLAPRQDPTGDQEGRPIEIFDFDAVSVGEVMQPITLIITAELNQSQIVEPEPEGRTDASAFAGTVEPTIFMRNFVRLMRSTWDTRQSMVHADSRIRIHAAVPVGTVVAVTGRIEQKFVRNGRPYIVIKSETRASGELVSEEWNTLIVSYEG